MLMISLLPLLCVAVLAIERTTIDDYLNTCIDDKGQHRSKPAPDNQLTAECAAWKDRACCDGPTQTSWLDVNWDHCSEKDMSPKCKKHFRTEYCMYYCSPNIGPWIVPFDSKTKRTERWMFVPLCKPNCDTWWNDCKDDYTCTDNWVIGFDWKNGSNYCKDKTCHQFKDYYADAKSFCEGIWDDTYIVVPETSPCMVFEFTGQNPNLAVTKCQVQHIVGQGNTHHQHNLLFLGSLAILNLLLK